MPATLKINVTSFITKKYQSSTKKSLENHNSWMMIDNVDMNWNKLGLP